MAADKPGAPAVPKSTLRWLPQHQMGKSQEPAVEDLETLIPRHASLSPPPEDLIGTLVGQRYRIHSQLGRGGTAAVYLAEDQTLGRSVALKVLSPDLASTPRWVHRFRREARAVARLEHDNIVKIYDYGETANGLLYFVMEYLRGNSLAHLLQESAALPLWQVRHIAVQVCRAIQAAHDVHIVHRDLKPGNIMIIPQSDGPPLVKVLDFGIAMLAEEEEPQGRLTALGQTIGTPEYMSPEQVLGETPDQRSDIYALGCILYEMMTGNVPFSAEPRERVRFKHVFEAPRRPSEIRPEIPPALEAVCLRALEKNPEQRFQSMAEMEAALLLEEVPRLEPPPPSRHEEEAPRGEGAAPAGPASVQEGQRADRDEFFPDLGLMETTRPLVTAARPEPLLVPVVMQPRQSWWPWMVGGLLAALVVIAWLVSQGNSQSVQKKMATGGADQRAIRAALPVPKAGGQALQPMSLPPAALPAAPPAMSASRPVSPIIRPAASAQPSSGSKAPAAHRTAPRPAPSSRDLDDDIPLPGDIPLSSPSP
ncbi:MAG: protein kinase [Myxococcales bacterium]|nr:protein kinase [Myxococcota bacterium]MDW8280450.1 protein kinase [Myxococcales bacterium]